MAIRGADDLEVVDDDELAAVLADGAADGGGDLAGGGAVHLADPEGVLEEGAGGGFDSLEVAAGEFAPGDGLQVDARAAGDEARGEAEGGRFDGEELRGGAVGGGVFEDLEGEGGLSHAGAGGDEGDLAAAETSA